ncbi:DUF4405 domain-containing protein [Butyricicoccus faecihominis]|nr:DUF4405 domain-containing protein [Butyricicoccus faecihominis]
MLLTVLLPLLMAYNLIGEAAHEWLGLGMFLLLGLHHILNVRWSGVILRGRYGPYRILQTAAVLLLFLSMLGSMMSGIVQSKHIFTMVLTGRAISAMRTTHMLCAYWGFLLMGFHLGLHWPVIFNRWRGAAAKPLPPACRAAVWLMSAYGVYAFARRDLTEYLFLKTQYVFFDFSEPLPWFLLDYAAILALLTVIGHIAAKTAIRLSVRTQSQERKALA